MFKNGQVVKCVNSSGSIHIAEGQFYSVSHDDGKEICLVGVPGYYNSDAFVPWIQSQEAKLINYVDEGVGSFICPPEPIIKASKNDKEKPDLSLIPYSGMIIEAQAFMVGEKKYGRYNYTKGHKTSQLIAAIMRHASAYMQGEDNDQIDGQPHLGSIKACCSMIEEQKRLNTHVDDRPKK